MQRSKGATKMKCLAIKKVRGSFSGIVYRIEVYLMTCDVYYLSPFDNKTKCYIGSELEHFDEANRVIEKRESYLANGESVML